MRLVALGLLLLVALLMGIWLDRGGGNGPLIWFAGVTFGLVLEAFIEEVRDVW